MFSTSLIWEENQLHIYYNSNEFKCKPLPITAWLIDNASSSPMGKLHRWETDNHGPE